MARKDRERTPITLEEMEGLGIPSEKRGNFDTLLLTPRRHALIGVLIRHAASGEGIQLAKAAKEAGFKITVGTTGEVQKFYHLLQDLGAQLPNPDYGGGKRQRVEKALEEGLATATIKQLARDLSVSYETVQGIRRSQGLTKQIRTPQQSAEFTQQILQIWKSGTTSGVEIARRITQEQKSLGETPDEEKVLRAVRKALNALQKEGEITLSRARTKEEVEVLDQQILALAEQGITKSSEVAARLGIDTGTFRFRRKRLAEKETIPEKTIEKHIAETVRRLFTRGGIVTTDGIIFIAGDAMFKEFINQAENNGFYQRAKQQAKYVSSRLIKVKMQRLVTPDGTIMENASREMICVEKDGPPINVAIGRDGIFKNLNTASLFAGLTAGFLLLYQNQKLNPPDGFEEKVRKLVVHTIEDLQKQEQ